MKKYPRPQEKDREERLPGLVDRIPAVKDIGWRDRHRECRNPRDPGSKELPEPQNRPHAEDACDDRGQTQRPEMAAEKRLRQEDSVKMQRPVVVCRVVVVVSVRRHLVGEPPVHPLVKMRRLDLDQPEAQEERDAHNRDFGQWEL